MRLYLVSALTVATLVAALGAQQVQSASKAPILSQVRTLELIKTVPRQEVYANRTGVEWLKEILTLDCGRRYVTGGRIAGGHTARWGDYPSFVRLDIGGQLNSCGGTLLGPRHVITAAHCSWGDITGVYTTIYPRDKRPELRYEVAKFCGSRLYPKDWSDVKDIHHDVAIIKLARPVQFSRYVQPACLPGKSVRGQRNLRAVGLGNVFYKNKTEFFIQPEQLRQLPVSWIECPTDLVSDPKTKFCTFHEDPWYWGKQCLGDSGAPVYSWKDGRMVVAGLTSYGYLNSCQRDSNDSTVNTDIFETGSEVVKLLEECK